LLVPSSGSVLVDGRDIQSCIDDWQRQIGYVPQDIYLLDDSIRCNVAFGMDDDAVDEQAVRRALDVAQLTAFVDALPQGLDTVVGNRGVRLSGGQRQRLGIARALYHEPGVLVMDEATSALDSQTEYSLAEAIDRVRHVSTVIIVAHRLSTVRGCDRLYLMEQGRVVDAGAFDELASRHEYLRVRPVFGDRLASHVG
jgi:ATP-binding cassette, subfamily B, bacterial PglK